MDLCTHVHMYIKGITNKQTFIFSLIIQLQTNVKVKQFELVINISEIHATLTTNRVI